MSAGTSYTSVDALVLAQRCRAALLGLRHARDLFTVRSYNRWLTQPGLYGWLTRPLFPRLQGWYPLPEQPQNARHPQVKEWLETYEPASVEFFGVDEERHCERLLRLAEAALNAAAEVGLTSADLDRLVAAEKLAEDSGGAE